MIKRWIQIRDPAGAQNSYDWDAVPHKLCLLWLACATSTKFKELPLLHLGYWSRAFALALYSRGSVSGSHEDVCILEDSLKFNSLFVTTRIVRERYNPLSFV